jgi:hypothetical protein
MKLAEQVVEFIAKGLEKVLGQIKGLREQLAGIPGQIGIEVKPVNEVALGASIVLMQRLVDSTQSWVRAGMAGTGMGNLLTVQMQYLSREIASVFLPLMRSVSDILERVTAYFRSLTGDQQHSIRKWIETSAAILLVANVVPRLVSGLVSVVMPTVNLAVASWQVGMARIGAASVGAAATVSAASASAATATSAAATVMSTALTIATAGLNLLIGAAIALGTSLVVGTEGGRQSLSQFAKWAAGVAKQVVDTFEQIWAAAEPLWKGLVSIVSTAWQQISAATSRVWSSVVSIFNSVWNAIKPLLETVSQLAEAFASPMFEAARIGWALIEATVHGAAAAISMLMAVTRPLLGLFRITLAPVIALFEFLGKVIGKVSDWIGSVSSQLSSSFGGMASLFNSIFAPIIPLFDEIYSAVVEISRVLGDELLSALSEAGRMFGDLFGGWDEFLKAFVETIKNTVATIRETVKFLTSSIASTLNNAIQTMASMARAVGLESMARRLENVRIDLNRQRQERQNEERAPKEGRPRESLEMAGGGFGSPDQLWRRLQEAGLRQEATARENKKVEHLERIDRNIATLVRPVGEPDGKPARSKLFGR